jgi:hypothetical protein
MAPSLAKASRLGLAGALSLLLTSSSALGEPLAFPGAVGQGAVASGGRGGDVYQVTTLADYQPQAEPQIPGSLRHAIHSADGPRTIVFDVAGSIALRAPLKIRRGDLTIAGQSSPGGVTLWGYPLEIIGAKNVVIRHLRVRTGDFHARAAAGGRAAGADSLDPANANAIAITGGSEQVILDHVSASWGIDEVLSVTKSRDVTVQHSIIAEGLNDSYHPKGPHGYGSLLRGELTPEDQRRNTGGYTFFGNLWAHHRARNPSIGGQQSLDPGQAERERRRTDVNLVNNVVYDWGDQAVHRSEGGDVRINLVGNIFICGPAKRAKHFFRENADGRTELFARGNYADLDQDATHDGEHFEGDAAEQEGLFVGFGGGDRLTLDGEPLPFYGVVALATRPTADAYNGVLGGAGASLWRDSADRRIVASVRQRTGGLIDSQEELRSAAGDLPGIDDLPIVRRVADFDADRDGMADDFERRHGLDPADPADATGTGLSDEGYTNLEIYLNALASEGSFRAD